MAQALELELRVAVLLVGGVAQAHCTSQPTHPPLIAAATALQTEVLAMGVPEFRELSQMMSEAVAPAFILVAVVNLTSNLLGRRAPIVERVRYLNEIPDEDVTRGHLKADIPRLQARARLLDSATRLALASGMCTSLLLIVGFVTAFLRLQHVYSAAVLFVLAVGFLGASLFKFGQEVKIDVSGADQYR
jgi:hypothetical protein